MMIGLLLSAVATVATPSVGNVDVECADARGWTFRLSSVPQDGADVVTVDMSSPTESQPPQFKVNFSFPGVDARHVWSTSYDKTFTIWPGLWERGRSYASQLASDAPMLVVFNESDEAKFAMAASEAFDRVGMGATVNERTCRVEASFTFFAQTVSPRSSYSVKIRLDRRTRFWGDAVRETCAWISKTAGFVPADVPESAYDPLYSTWYAYLQDVHAAPLEKEAELAASLGMKTMILDDGWQKEKSASFYSAVGDWMPVASRFPDMKAHVAAVHKAGLKYMLWLSVPYVGDESAAWKRFEKKMLTTHGQKSPGRVGVLDPRFPEVREYLISTYERVVGEWGFDGVKLDFIDSFGLPGTDPAAAEKYAGRDFKSLPAAVDRLLKDVVARLKKINPDVLIEFRQHYIGPAIRQYGNMLRAADAPADIAGNRRRICDLRLTSGLTAVHSDMLVWSADETPEGAAKAILSVLFSTIQYSMVLQTIPEPQCAVVRHWLDFSQRHRHALLKGAFRPHHPEAGYPLIEAEDDSERITAVYSEGQVVPADTSAKPVYLINATGASSVVVELKRDATWETFDTFGRRIGATSAKAGLIRVAVPVSGYAVIR